MSKTTPSPSHKHGTDFSCKAGEGFGYVLRGESPLMVARLSKFCLYPNNAKRQGPFCAISYGIKNLQKP